jgi:hypothetical protein
MFEMPENKTILTIDHVNNDGADGIVNGVRLRTMAFVLIV